MRLFIVAAVLAALAGCGAPPPPAPTFPEAGPPSVDRDLAQWAWIMPGLPPGAADRARADCLRMWGGSYSALGDCLNRRMGGRLDGLAFMRFQDAVPVRIVGP
jgi:hypothetical protein